MAGYCFDIDDPRYREDYDSRDGEALVDLHQTCDDDYTNLFDHEPIVDQYGAPVEADFEADVCAELGDLLLTVVFESDFEISPN